MERKVQSLKRAWIKVEDAKSREAVQEFILSLAEEDLLGEIEVILYAEKARAKYRLSRIYSISEAAIPVLKEKYGDGNVKLTNEADCSSSIKTYIPTPDPLERIADALEAISSTLDSIDQSLDSVADVLGDCRVKNRNGSAIAITGTVDHV